MPSMNGSPESTIRALMTELQPEMESLHSVGNGVLRINLKPDDLSLWQDTYKTVPQPCNILLACEASSSDLETTQLTWVVGAAIQSTFLNSTDAIVALLKQLGVSDGLADSVPAHCPGLAISIPWAFYLERHGWLTACPIVASEQILMTPA